MANNVLCFIREIDDIEEHIHKNVKLAKRFIELDHHSKIDESSMSLLNELKYKKIPAKLPASNIFKFNVKWDQETGISLSSHQSYIEHFAQTFYDQVKNLIDKNQQRRIGEFKSTNHNDQTLLQEVLDHAYFCKETAQKFHGRQDLLIEVKNKNKKLC